MATEPATGVVETLTLRFEGKEEDGSEVQELRASHVAEVLQGLVGLNGEFAKAGVFGEGAAGSEVLVRPAREGSFLIEVLRIVQENPEAAGGAVGVPSLSSIIWWSTKSVRAGVADFDYLENGNVKVTWQDNTAAEIPQAAWVELQKRDKPRKRHLRKILAPLSDPRVASVAIENPPADADADTSDQPEPFELTKPDYDATRADEEVTEQQNIFETEAQMAAIDFDNPRKWRVRTKEASRAAIVEDEDFLARVANGLAIRKTDIFRLQVREDTVEKNGRTTRTWTVLKVESFRRAAHDDDA
ncbi:hypothetical protein SAMN04488543_1305 [Friedmanniella luteola]|uniref:Uncharacterized protein n=1 Tax=Friedmanniella luteola TaxID=546871 RepID=A0A1H1QEX9_9ACTN|nr:hypothetical protein [Friedmanniella luteola]SDS22042.1 hypothetical protein SAMN04488543_1305 [Friedmanniella luteola]